MMCGLGDIGNLEDADVGEQRLRRMRVPDLTNVIYDYEKYGDAVIAQANEEAFT